MARFLSDEERKKLEDIWQMLSDMEDDLCDALLQPMKNLQSSPTPHLSKVFSTSSISPTDVDARGKFEYQEPEVDEQGTYYGYKILKIYHNDEAGIHRLVSPRFTVMWNEDGCLTADREPNEHSMHGLHFTKRPDHPELENFAEKRSVLVKCALSGTVIETEQGFRAEHAQIVGVYAYGYWQSYQNYSERSLTNSRRNPSQEWEYRKNFNPYKNSSYFADTDS